MSNERTSNLEGTDLGEAIKAAHPTRTGRHDLYAQAAEWVGARHDKYKLVELVNWLLHLVEDRKETTTDRVAAEPEDSAPCAGEDMTDKRKKFIGEPVTEEEMRAAIGTEEEVEAARQRIAERNADSSSAARRVQHAPQSGHPCIAWEGRVRTALGCHDRGAPDALVAILDIMADVQEFEREACAREVESLRWPPEELDEQRADLNAGFTTAAACVRNRMAKATAPKGERT